MERSLRDRLIFGLIMMAALLALLWLDHLAEQWTRGWGGRIGADTQPAGIAGLGLLVLLIGLLPAAILELARLFTATHVQPSRLLASLGAAALVVHAFLTQFAAFQPVAASTLAMIVVGVMLLAALKRAWSRQSEGAILQMAGTVLATLYLGGLSWFLMALRVKDAARSEFRGSTMVIVTILLVVKFTDIGAYFVGRAIGRHKLIAWLSPGKTWEGLAGGVLCAALAGVACAPWTVHLPWWKGLVFGAVIGGVGQLGDLLESLMKRDAQVKDSGRLVPGFGGVLDVIDSPLLAAPFAYLLFSIFTG